MCVRRKLTYRFFLLLAVSAPGLVRAPLALAWNAPDIIPSVISQGEVYVFPRLHALLQSFHLEIGVEKRLGSRLQNARAAFNALDQAGACILLNAFLHEVQTQTVKKIPAEVVVQLVGAANEVEDALGCP